MVRRTDAVREKRKKKKGSSSSSSSCYVTFSPVSEDVTYTTPVIVFVHGWDAKRSGVWSTFRSLIDYDKYRCAFVNLDYRGSIRANGAEITRQLVAVTERYDVPTAVIVAHSKGGLDVQGAILYDGAERYIECVVTLSTPHWGSPLADVLYSAVIQKVPPLMNRYGRLMCDAVADMRVPCMAAFRERFDNTKRCTEVVFMTLSSAIDDDDDDDECHRSIFRTILNMYGPNDGMVVESASLKPGGYHLGTLPMDHERTYSSPEVWTIVETCVTDKQIPVTLTPLTYDGRAGTIVGTVASYALRTVTNNLCLVLVIVALFVVIVRQHRRRRRRGGGRFTSTNKFGSSSSETCR